MRLNPFAKPPLPPQTASIADAFDDPAAFGGAFPGPSWGLWRAIIKSAFALPMTDDEVAAFRSVADRDPPRAHVKELWIIAGRRAGKDSVAAGIAAWFGAFQNYDGLLRPGERATIACLAVDRGQAAIVQRFTRALLETPMLAGRVARETNDGLEMKSGAEIVIKTNDFRSVRGRTYALVIMDEIAYWRDEASANPDVETYRAIRPGLVTVPGSMIVGMSSPYRRSGLLYEKWRDHYGKNDDRVLVIRAPSKVLNPTVDQDEIDEDMAKDPVAARAEWLSEWRDDVNAFLPRDLIEAAVDRDVKARPPIPGVRYFCFIDASGGVSDAYTLAIAHRDANGMAILDCIREIMPPFNAEQATAELAGIVRSYRCSEVTGDAYGQVWVVNAWERNHIKLNHTERDRSAIYQDTIPLFTSGRVRLLDDAKLVTQLSQLERRPMVGGRDRIDHPKGKSYHDDIANSVSGALTLAAANARGPIRVSQSLLERSRRCGPRVF